MNTVTRSHRAGPPVLLPTMRIVHALVSAPPAEPVRLLDVLDAEIRTEFGDLLHAPASAVLAGLDQHAAAVRDVLGPGAGRLHPGDLAAYARGVATVAAGWNWPDVSAEGQSWLRLRLASVLHLARSHGYGAVAVQPVRS